MDSGLVCHLLAIDTERALARSPFRGGIFEGFVASEITKHQVNTGGSRALYYFRDQQGLEVDFVWPLENRKVRLVEAKASSTVMPEAAVSLERLGRAMSKTYVVDKRVVYQRLPSEGTSVSVLKPGIRAVGLEDLLKT